MESKGKYDLLKEVRHISDMANIHYIRQKEPKGLGHAIYCAKSFIGNEPFAQPGKDGGIQLTDALNILAQREEMYAYNFVGRRYDVGDKQGFLEATVEFALRRDDLRVEFLEYLTRVVGRETNNDLSKEAAGMWVNVPSSCYWITL